MKHLLRIVVILLVTVILSSFGISFENTIVNTLYIVICIIFSALLVLTVSFNLDKVTNEYFLNKCRNKIYYIQKQYIIYFVTATIIVCIEGYSFSYSYKIISFNSSSLYTAIMFFLLVYFITNFMQLQKLKDRITDKIIKETSNTKR